MALGKLFVVGTPIGNLKDLTFRALETLKQVDLIICEDTRQTRKICDHYQIETPLLSYHQHSKIKRVEEISELIGQGKNLALVSDAGTPTISDPGGKLIEFLIRNYNNLEIIPIPGPSAVLAALSISGFSADKFVFLGFCPQKRSRKKFFQKIDDSEYPVVFFESPHRILKTLTELDRFSKLRERRFFVCRELTKKFETVYRGNLSQVLEKIKKDNLKGEFVIVVNS